MVSEQQTDTDQREPQWLVRARAGAANGFLSINEVRRMESMPPAERDMILTVVERAIENNEEKGRELRAAWLR